MRNVPNSITQSLIRHLPLILENISNETMRNSTRLSNAVRLTKIIVKRLERIEHKQATINDKSR